MEQQKGELYIDKKQVASAVVWVTVGFVVCLNVWQTYEILELKKGVHRPPSEPPRRKNTPQFAP